MRLFKKKKKEVSNFYIQVEDETAKMRNIQKREISRIYNRIESDLHGKILEAAQNGSTCLSIPGDYFKKVFSENNTLTWNDRYIDGWVRLMVETNDRLEEEGFGVCEDIPTSGIKILWNAARR